MKERATPMMLATAALAAFALLLAAPVSAYVPEGDGVHANGTQSRVPQQSQATTQGTIPYLSHGIGVDESLFSGTSQVDARHQALVGNRAASQSVGLDPAIQTAVDAHQSSVGLTGDSAATRYVAQETPTASSGGGRDIDWTSFGAGAGMAALLAAGFVGILLGTRRRHTVGMS